jgi:uncharacterized membrane protein YkgB
MASHVNAHEISFSLCRITHQQIFLNVISKTTLLLWFVITKSVKFELESLSVAIDLFIYFFYSTLEDTELNVVSPLRSRGIVFAHL